MPREIQFEAEVGIKGTFPLLIQKYALPEEATVTSSVTDYSEEWKKAVHLDFEENKYLVLPNVNIEMSIREAAKGKKIGKNFLTKVVPTGISVEEFQVPILDDKNNKLTISDLEERDWLLTCPVVIQKKRVVKTRACIMKWQMFFNLQVLSPLLTPKIVEGLISEAGYCSGLGVWRPSSPSPGKYGQFDLIKFDVK
jgi:hypothetical protein